LDYSHLHGFQMLSTLKQAVREAATICPRPLQVYLWPFDLENGVWVWVTCDVCSRLRHDVRDRQMSDAHHRLMPPPYGGGGIIKVKSQRGWLRSFEHADNFKLLKSRQSNFIYFLDW